MDSSDGSHFFKTCERSATHPVRYTYDVYGNKTTMTTYRHEGGTRFVASGGAGHAALSVTGGTTVGRGVLTAPPGRHDDMAL